MNASVKRLTILRIVSTILGVFYSILQVNFFGVSRNIEIYFAAQALVYVVTSLTQSGQLSEVFLPLYLNIKASNGRIQAQKAFSVVLTWLSVGGLLLICGLFVFSPYLMMIMVPGFDMSDQHKASEIFQSLLPLILLIITGSFLNTVLNAENIYGRVELAGVINYSISIIVLVVSFEYIGVWSLVVSLYLGKMVEMSITIRYFVKHRFRLWLLFASPTFDHWSFFRTSGMTFLYTGATQLYTVTLTSTASFMPQGVYAIYQYVQLIFSKVNTMIVGPVATVFFTKVSELTTVSDNVLIKSEMRKSITYTVVTGLALFFIVLIAGDTGLGFLWYSRGVTEEDIRIGYYFLVGFFFLFVFQGFSILYRKLLVAYGEARMFYFLGSAAMVFSAVLVYIVPRMMGETGFIVAIMLARLSLMIGPVAYFIRKFKFVVVPNTRSLFLGILISTMLCLGLYSAKPYLQVSFDPKRLALLITLIWEVMITLILLLPLLLYCFPEARLLVKGFVKRLYIRVLSRNGQR